MHQGHRSPILRLLAGLGLLALSAMHAAAQPLPLYHLDLRFHPDDGLLTGRARIELPASAITDRTVRLDVSLPRGAVMDVQRVSSASGQALAYVEGDVPGVLEVRLEAHDATVEVEYSVPVDSFSLVSFGYYVFAEFGASPRAYPMVVRPYGQSYRFADFRVIFEHPASLAVLTTGGEGTRHLEGNRTRAHYEAMHVEAFAIVAGEGFRVERHETDGVPVVAFYHPDHAARFSMVIERAQEAAAWYRRTYGFFPLEQVGIIQGHPRWGGGYPLPNMFAVHLGLLDAEFLTWITAHELGHYYWGLYVLGDEERLDWLQLALGIWSDQRYLAERNGLSLPEQWRRARRQGDWITDYLEAVVAGHEQRLGLDREEEQALRFDYNSLVRHGKAATGLYLQSLLIGPERFLDLQRHLLAAYRHRPLPVASFIGLLEEAGAADATAFFEAWARGDATIGLAVDSAEPDGERGGWRITVRRTGPVPYPIMVEAVSAAGEVVRHTVAPGARRDTLRVAFAPAHIRLDPEGLIPMWNGAHPEMRAAYARALERARLDEPFILLAQAVLEEGLADDDLRYRLARRLFGMARWKEAAALWPSTLSCESREACLAAIYSARAMVQLGRRAEAAAWLDELRAKAGQYEVLRVWKMARDEAAR